MPLDSLQSKILQLHSVQQQLARLHGMALPSDLPSRSSGSGVPQAALGAVRGSRLPHQGSVPPGSSMHELLPDTSKGSSAMPTAASLQSPRQLQQQLLQVRAGAGHCWPLHATCVLPQARRGPACSRCSCCSCTRHVRLHHAHPQAYADVSALQLQLAGSVELQGELDYLRSFLEQLASHDATSSGGSSGWGSRDTSWAVDELEERREEGT